MQHDHGDEEAFYLFKKEGKSEIIVERSRFIGYAFPVRQLQDIDSILTRIRKEHHSARHICYGYRLHGESGIEERHQDDGEPARTAGYPLWQLLEGDDIRNALIVVVRYFGGIKLGTGGLSRAYRDCGRQAMEAAGVAEHHPEVRFQLMVPYRLMDTLEHRMQQVPSLRAEEKEYKEEVLITFQVRKANLAESRKLLAEVLQIAPDFTINDV